MNTTSIPIPKAFLSYLVSASWNTSTAVEMQKANSLETTITHQNQITKSKRKKL